MFETNKITIKIAKQIKLQLIGNIDFLSLFHSKTNVKQKSMNKKKKIDIKILNQIRAIL